MWLVMATLLGSFAYFKGWIFADFQNISPQKAHILLSKSDDLLLIDVRSTEAFEKDHLKGAISIPLAQLSEHNITRKKLLVYSERGESSVEASRILVKRGFEVQNLEGGVVFWIRAGFELEK